MVARNWVISSGNSGSRAACWNSSRNLPGLAGDVDERGEGVVGEVLAAALGGEPGAGAVEETGKALAAVAEAFSAHLGPRGVELGAAAWLVTATTAPTCPLARPASS